MKKTTGQMRCGQLEDGTDINTRNVSNKDSGGVAGCGDTLKLILPEPGRGDNKDIKELVYDRECIMMYLEQMCSRRCKYSF